MDNYQLIFTTESQEDIRNGFLWYEEKRLGLGFDFMLAIKARCGSVQRNPFAHAYAPTTVPNIRRAIVPKFSYLIFYTIINNSAIILAIVSSKQNPAVWKTRLGDTGNVGFLE